MPDGQINNPQMKDILDSEFQRSSDPSFLARIAVSKYLNMPGLKGFWGPSYNNDTAHAGTPYLTDMSGNGYYIPAVSAPVQYTPMGITCYALDGVNDWFSLADNSHFDITATEAWQQYPGIAMGAWICPTRVIPFVSNEGIIDKWDVTTNNCGYILELNPINANRLSFSLSDNGINIYAYDHTKALVRSTWYFVAATYNPGMVLNESAGVRVWVNDQMEYHAASDRGTPGLPASIFNNAAPLQLGSRQGATYPFMGYQAYWWLVGNYLQEGEIFNLYETTKYLFPFANEKGTSY